MKKPTWWVNGALGLAGGQFAGPYNHIIDCPIDDCKHGKVGIAHAIGAANSELTIPAKAYVKGKTLYGSIYMTAEGPRFSPKNTK